MKSSIFAFAILLTNLGVGVYASTYGNYDLKKLIIASEASSDKKPAFNLSYLDQVMDDLALHAKNYPVQFDSINDRARAVQDVKCLSNMLDVLLDTPDPDPEILRQAGLLNSIGHNLDIPGAAEKASMLFQKLLTMLPSDPQGNYMYGAFLGGTCRPDESLPYLQKALSLGVPTAAYSLGISYLMIGDKEKALEYLEKYRGINPGDTDIDKLIDGIQHGKIEAKNN